MSFSPFPTSVADCYPAEALQMQAISLAQQYAFSHRKSAELHVLGMVVMRIKCDSDIERLPFAFTVCTAPEETWDIAVDYRKDAQTLTVGLNSQPENKQANNAQQPTMQLMEFWNGPFSASEKQACLQELQIALENYTSAANSSVVTHNFSILQPLGGYHRLQWVCSILPDALRGNVSRITASLRVVPPQQSRFI